MAYPSKGREAVSAWHVPASVWHIPAKQGGRRQFVISVPREATKPNASMVHSAAIIHLHCDKVAEWVPATRAEIPPEAWRHIAHETKAGASQVGLEIEVKSPTVRHRHHSNVKANLPAHCEVSRCAKYPVPTQKTSPDVEQKCSTGTTM